MGKYVVALREGAAGTFEPREFPYRNPHQQAEARREADRVAGVHRRAGLPVEVRREEKG